MRKLCQTFQLPFKPSQDSMMFHTTYLPPTVPVSFDCDPCDYGKISESIFFFLAKSPNAGNLLRQKPLIPAPFY